MAKHKVEYGHVMVDLETLDNVPSSTIIQLGAVEFDIHTGDTKSEFLVNIDIASNQMFNRTISESTLLWWFSQSKEAIDQVINGKHKFHLSPALIEFRNWFLNMTVKGELNKIWCKGAKFDFAILSSAYRDIMVEVPWHYGNENCMRTIMNLRPAIKKAHKFKGVAHNAKDDCFNQIEVLTKVYKTL